MKTFAAVALVAAVSAIDTATFEFMQYISKYGKSYDTIEEFNTRMALFQKTNTFVKEWNSQPNQTSTVGHNFISDMTEEEKKGLRGLLEDGTERVEAPLHQVLPGDTYDNTIDWCTTTNPKGVSKCTPIKNQGQCGSCWTFSSTGAIEGAWAISTGQLVDLAEQELVDCAGAKYGSMGCNGGQMEGAFKYVIEHGQCALSAYPYTAKDGTCEKCTAVAHISSCSDVKPNVQISLKGAVSQQPVSIAIEADTKYFQSYSGGILTSSSCGTNLDHGVLIVGYGKENGIEYWLVKNSWGTSWGDKGYVKIARSDSTDDAGICGIAMDPSFPTV